MQPLPGAVERLWAPQAWRVADAIFPIPAGAGGWLHPVLRDPSLDIVSCGELTSFQGTLGLTCLCLKPKLSPTKALKAQVSHSGFGTPLGSERPAAVLGHTATGIGPGASPVPTWSGSCAFKAFPHPWPAQGGRGGAGSQPGSGDSVLRWSATGGPALQPGEAGWNGLWLTPSELLDIYGGSLGLGPPGNIWRSGFQPQLCHVLAVLWGSPFSQTSVYAPA